MRPVIQSRTTPADSWRWIKWDLPGRLLPLALLPVLALRLSHRGAAAFGLTLSHPGRDLLLALPVSLLGFLIAAVFGELLSRDAGRWFVPDRRDLALQVSYYVALNAPIEEWFFRGFVQTSLINSWHAPLFGLLAATLLFGSYHFLGGWGWRPVAGSTVAGLGIGLLYLWQPQPPSLLLPILAHAAITCGFLALGPFLVLRLLSPRAARATPVACNPSGVGRRCDGGCPIGCE